MVAQPVRLADWQQPSFDILGNTFWQGTPTKTQGDGGLHAIFLNGGRSHNVSWNLFLGNFTAGVFLNDLGLQGSAGEGIGDPGFAGEFKHMHDVKYREAPWAERYPELASLNDFISLPLIGNCSTDWRCPAAPFGSSFRSNVIVNQSARLLGETPRHSCVRIKGVGHSLGMPPAAFILPNHTDFAPSNVDIAGNWQAGFADPGWLHSPRLSSERSTWRL